MGGAARVVLTAGADVRPITQEIQRARPGVCVWYGRATGSWWALVRLADRARLVEAANPRELREAIDHPESWPWPR
jgi:hypothetical protein